MKESFLAIVLLIAVFSFGSAMNAAAPANLEFEHDEHVGERLRQMVQAGEVPIPAMTWLA